MGALDLADLASVHGADSFAGPLHVLVAERRRHGLSGARVGPGWEAQLATDHLVLVLVARLGRPRWLRAGAVAVLDGPHAVGVPVRGPALHVGLDTWLAHGQAKTPDSRSAVHLDALGRDDGVRALGVHPGGLPTPLQRHLPPEEMGPAGWRAEDGTPHERFEMPEQGPAPSPDLDGVSWVDAAAPPGGDLSR